MSIEPEVTVVDYLGYLMFRHDSETTYLKKEVTHAICKEWANLCNVPRFFE